MGTEVENEQNVFNSINQKNQHSIQKHNTDFRIAFRALVSALYNTITEQCRGDSLSLLSGLEAAVSSPVL